MTITFSFAFAAILAIYYLIAKLTYTNDQLLKHIHNTPSIKKYDYNRRSFIPIGITYLLYIAAYLFLISKHGEGYAINITGQGNTINVILATVFTQSTAIASLFTYIIIKHELDEDIYIWKYRGVKPNTFKLTLFCNSLMFIVISVLNCNIISNTLTKLEGTGVSVIDISVPLTPIITVQLLILTMYLASFRKIISKDPFNEVDHLNRGEN